MILLVYLPRASLAGNGLLAAAWYQAKLGKFCAQVKSEDVARAGFNCSLAKEDSLFGMQPTANSILDKLVFEEAATRQVQKDKCISEAIEAIRHNPENLTHWKASVTMGWLRLKKAQLMRTTCRRLFWNYLPREDQLKYGLSGSYERARHARNPLVDAWKGVCLNETVAAALASAEDLMLQSLPVVSSNEIFDVFEKHRDSIVTKATGNPLSDQEILNMDLSDLKHHPISVHGPGLDKGLDEFLSNYSAQRRGMAESIDKTKAEKGNLQSLDSDTRDYLYRDGTVARVLLDRGLMKEDEKGNPELSTGAVCILSWNESSLTGDLLDASPAFLIPAGVVFKILGTALPAGLTVTFGGAAAAVYKKLSLFERLKKSVSAGLLTGVGYDAVKQIRKSCFSSAAQAARMSDMNAHDLDTSLKGVLLPGDFMFRIDSMAFRPSEVPSCTKTNEQGQKVSPDLLAKPGEQGSCWSQVLTLAFPWQLALVSPFIAN